MVLMSGGLYMKVRINLTIGLIFLVLGIVIWIMIPNQISVGFSASQYSLGSRGLPYLIAAMMIIVSLVVIVRSAVFKLDRVIVIELKDELRAFVFYAMILSSILIMKAIGFLLSGLLIGWATLLYIRTKRITYYIYVGVFTLVIYVIFVYALNIKLPAGVFQGR